MKRLNTILREKIVEYLQGIGECPKDFKTMKLADLAKLTKSESNPYATLGLLAELAIKEVENQKI